ncbi:hypothetical protein [Undibacterium terreum]|uniref:Uncharacterized protein n=1 Tax=Undibacterium terreum TaxID=1224302 RepID=A0A916XEU6_9BURK|nr:hypothetical protein [Undibacterium terreum]GGC65287.1 hypothetical protein GCM10011396_10350 [Undibacterium terreum]
MHAQVKESRTFVAVHMLLLCIVLVGFARSFYLRGLFFTQPLPGALQLHGIALTLWFGIAVLQGLLVQTGRREWHAKIAWLAIPIVAGVILSGAWVNTNLALQLTSAKDPENMFIWANYMSLLSFVALVAAAVIYRRRLATHYRLMLFASIAIIGPAFARFAFWPVIGLGLGAAPALAVGGMLLLVILAICYDLVVLRRVKAATLAGLAGIFVPLIGGLALAITGMGYALLHHS